MWHWLLPLQAGSAGEETEKMSEQTVKCTVATSPCSYSQLPARARSRFSDSSRCHHQICRFTWRASTAYQGQGIAVRASHGDRPDQFNRVLKQIPLRNAHKAIIQLDLQAFSWFSGCRWAWFPIFSYLRESHHTTPAQGIASASCRHWGARKG